MRSTFGGKLNQRKIIIQAVVVEHDAVAAWAAVAAGCNSSAVAAAAVVAAGVDEAAGRLPSADPWQPGAEAGMQLAVKRNTCIERQILFTIRKRYAKSQQNKKILRCTLLRAVAGGAWAAAAAGRPPAVAGSAAAAAAVARAGTLPGAAVAVAAASAGSAGEMGPGEKPVEGGEAAASRSWGSLQYDLQVE